MVCLKTASLTAVLAAACSVAIGIDSQSTSDIPVAPSLRSSRVRLATTSKSSGDKRTRGKKSPKRYAESHEYDEEKSTASGEGIADDGTLPPLKRFTRERTITLHGVNHKEPLTAEEAIFLEDTLTNAMNVAHPDDDVTTISTIMTDEELDDDYYTTITGNPEGSDRTFLRGTRGGHDLPKVSIDGGDAFAIHMVLDMTCHFCNDNDDDDDDASVFRTRSLTFVPVKGGACQWCDLDDDDDDDNHGIINEYSNVVDKAPSPGPVLAHANLDGLPGRNTGSDSAVETTFCEAVRISNFSRFRTVITCSIN